MNAESLHKLLTRQLRRHFGSLEAVPSELYPFLKVVDQAYQQADEERGLMERSLETVSAELADRLQRIAAVTEELRKANSELVEALGQVKALSGLIPICAHCKKVRDDQGYWNAVESFIGERSDARFSHSICQSCGPKLYGDVWAEVSAEMIPP